MTIYPRVSESTQQQMITEYEALRQEILARAGYRNQAVIYAIVGLGAVLSLTSRTGMDAFVLLAYPLLVTGLAMTWSHSDMRVHEIAEYIMTRIETQLPGIAWEGYLRRKYSSSPRQRRLAQIDALIVFIGTQAISVGAALHRHPWQGRWLGGLYWYDLVLLGLDLAACAFTIHFTGRRGRALRSGGK
jgi:hypothetical protein